MDAQLVIEKMFVLLVQMAIDELKEKKKLNVKLFAP